MLWFVGLGINGTESLSQKAKEVVSGSDVVYFEQFTSPISDEETNKIKQIAKEFRLAPRWLVEDGKEILEESKSKQVCLLSFGDPYIATTHIELRVRAISENIRTGTVHASSALTSLVGECGLHYYKIGKTVTIMSSIPSTTAYYTIFENLKQSIHTVVLLEYNQNKGFFLEPKIALQSLLDAENGQRRKVIVDSTFAIVASRIGQDSQKVTSGNISSLVECDFGPPPHSIVIPGAMHFTESDALKALSRCIDEPHDNIVERISAQMMKKYVPMIRRALEETKDLYRGKTEFQPVLENAYLYIRDAERFFEQGQDELAILSIGYADGLVDALRIARGIEPDLSQMD